MLELSKVINNFVTKFNNTPFIGFVMLLTGKFLMPLP